MKLGIDFDNTIANYDHSFEEYARTNSIILHGNETPKISVRKALGKKTGGNLDWTRLQGEVYGSKMSDAQPNEGFVAFLEECLSRAWQVVIISHRTIYPAIGKPTNLHSVAFEWLKDHRIVSEDTLAHSQCFYETTLDSKIFRISQETVMRSSMICHPSFSINHFLLPLVHFYSVASITPCRTP
jgi:hypothetical protein